MDLFDNLKENNKQIPLAEILRPKTIEEYLGQYKVTGSSSPLMNLLKTNIPTHFQISSNSQWA